MIKSFGENRLLVEFADDGDIVTLAAKAHAAAEVLRQRTEITEAVSGIDSVCVSFDPASSPYETVERIVTSTLAQLDDKPVRQKRICIEIPVCYGGAFGPDLEAVAGHCGLSKEGVIARHIEKPFPVLTVGFAPGFAYLGPIDKTISAPRLDNPRPHVAAGSVGIAGAFTGIYPLSSPGGWRLIGRTPISLFHPKSDSPFTLRPGDEVQFKAISTTEFDELVS